MTKYIKLKEYEDCGAFICSNCLNTNWTIEVIPDFSKNHFVYMKITNGQKISRINLLKPEYIPVKDNWVLTNNEIDTLIKILKEPNNEKLLQPIQLIKNCKNNYEYCLVIYLWELGIYDNPEDKMFIDINTQMPDYNLLKVN